MVESATAACAARSWTQILAPYRNPNSARSVVEIIITFMPLAALWTLASTAIRTGYWEFSPLLAVLAAGFLVRLFTIQHDCGHGSFFRHRVPAPACHVRGRTCVFIHAAASATDWAAAQRLAALA